MKNEKQASVVSVDVLFGGDGGHPENIGIKSA